MNDPVLSLVNATKSFGEKRVLDQLNFDVVEGSVVGLLGKNGSGKTTLLKCALGLLKPQQGEVLVFGEPASDIATDGIDCTDRCPATSAPTGAIRDGERNFKTGPPIPSVISSL